MDDDKSVNWLSGNSEAVRLHKKPTQSLCKTGLPCDAMSCSSRREKHWTVIFLVSAFLSIVRGPKLVSMRSLEILLVVYQLKA